jgi:glutaredoxin
MNEARENQPGSDERDNRAVSINKQPLQNNRKRKKGGLLIILILLVTFIFFTRHESVTTIDCTPEIIASKPDIIMLGAWWCPYCHQAKRYFQQNQIHYCEYDMESTKTGKQLYEKYGGGIPVLIIGKYQLNGFNESQVETALSLAKQ